MTMVNSEKHLNDKAAIDEEGRTQNIIVRIGKKRGI